MRALFIAGFGALASICSAAQAVVTLSVPTPPSVLSGPSPVSFDVPVYLQLNGVVPPAVTVFGYDLQLVFTPSSPALAGQLTTLGFSMPDLLGNSAPSTSSPPVNSPINPNLLINGFSINGTTLTSDGTYTLTTLKLRVAANTPAGQYDLSLLPITPPSDGTSVAFDTGALGSNDMVVQLGQINIVVPEPTTAAVCLLVAPLMMRRTRR
jgi:hypothetical protein